jgi:hypothetical protein
MLVAMINISELKQSILVVVIEQENLERMKLADPITLESHLAGGMLPPPGYPLNFSVLIAHEEDSEELYKQAKIGGVGFMRWLERGRKFNPSKDGLKNARPLVTKDMN